MADAGIRVEVSAELAALTRANIIGHVAGDLAYVLPGVKEGTVESIIYGFREAILSGVEFLVTNKWGKVVGYMAIRVDWDTYSIVVVDGSGENVFRVDPKQPVSDQVAPLLARTRSYIQQSLKGVRGRKCEVIYAYRNVRSEEAKAKQRAFREKYNLVDLSDKDRERLNAAKELDKGLVVADSQLPEVTVTFRCRNNGP
ncbi:hypothetical protein [Thermostaphylospora chromogena]|uniref:hypothetical protein n=1 Tax=Thermostaphylospora chromogena TaxID=35622 RepID=UPI0010426375|nr:hypothetical protein [Thermostaphylospora chromogena]